MLSPKFVNCSVVSKIVALVIFFCGSAICIVANKPMQFRPNPHLHSTPPAPEANEQSQTRHNRIPEHAKKKFCLNVRGWAVPTEHMFIVFEDLFKNEALDSKAVETMRFWLDRGFGYALSTLIEEVYPNHFPKFVKLLKSEYKGTNAICPFRCTYKDYVELQQQLAPEGRKTLDQLCRPDCRNHKTNFSDYDEDFCECLVNQKSPACVALAEDDIRMIKKTTTNQNASRRDYEFRSKRNTLNSENTQAIENSKKEMINMLHGMMNR